MAEFPVTWRLQVKGADGVKARLQEINEQFKRRVNYTSLCPKVKRG